MDAERILDVKNRSSSIVGYTIPEENIRREFLPGEVKKLKYNELEKLSFQPGGRSLMANYLQIREEAVNKELEIKTEPEYYMSEDDIVKLMKEGSLEAFLDCLDFAPAGIIDLIKGFAVSLPLENTAKRKALKDKTGFDVDSAIRHVEEEKNDVGIAEDEAPKRRVQVNSNSETTRRVKIINKEEKE